MNRFTFMGRLTAAPEIRRTQDGKPVVRFRFAVNRTYKRDGDPEADFFQLVMFGNPAERFEKLNVQKGTKLLIEGEVRNHAYTDKDGVKHYDFNFVANSFEFCEAKKAEQKPQETAPAYQTATPSYSDADNGFVFMDDASDEGLPWA